MILGNASVSTAFRGFSFTAMKILGTGWYMAYYFFNKKRAKIQSLKFNINPDLEITKVIWNLMDTKGIKTLLKLTLPGIRYRKNLFLLRTAKKLDFEFLNMMIKKSEDEFSINNAYSNLDKNYINELQDEENLNINKIKRMERIKEYIYDDERIGKFYILFHRLCKGQTPFT